MSSASPSPQDKQGTPLPAFAKAMMLRWWRDQATRLGAALETAIVADTAGEAIVDLDGRRTTVEKLTTMAEKAIDMVERMEDAGGPSKVAEKGSSKVAENSSHDDEPPAMRERA